MPKFKVGDKVKCIRGSTFNPALVEGEIHTVYGLHNGNSIYVDPECDIWWFASRFELVEPARKFDPKPGDTIVCNNGTKFTCIHISEYVYSHCYPNAKIVGIHPERGHTSHMNWDNYDGEADSYGYNINKIIPKMKELAVYSVRQVAEAIHEVTGVPKSDDFEYRVNQIDKHLAKVNDPDWKKFQEVKVEYERLKEKFND